MYDFFMYDIISQKPFKNTITAFQILHHYIIHISTFLFFDDDIISRSTLKHCRCLSNHTSKNHTYQYFINFSMASPNLEYAIKFFSNSILKGIGVSKLAQRMIGASNKV